MRRWIGGVCVGAFWRCKLALLFFSPLWLRWGSRVSEQSRATATACAGGRVQDVVVFSVCAGVWEFDGWWWWSSSSGERQGCCGKESCFGAKAKACRSEARRPALDSLEECCSYSCWLDCRQGLCVVELLLPNGRKPFQRHFFPKIV